jgi:hypothetical protein
MTTHTAPLSDLMARLRTIGEKLPSKVFEAIREHGQEAVAPLIEIVREYPGDDENAPVQKYWATYHAIQLLGDLRAAEAVEPILDLLDEDDDYVDQHLPESLAKIGRPALEPLRARLFAPDADFYGVARAGNALVKMAELHPELRPAIVAMMVERFDADVPNDEPELESGQLVVDKARCWAAMQLTLHLNAWSDFYYQYVYGDKETFHLAWRMLDRPYAMPPYPSRMAVGVWSQAPATDAGAWTQVQHDFAGRPIFHHRTSTGKWNLLGENLRFEGLPHHDFCLDVLADLRARWDGRVAPAPRPSRMARTASELAAASPFLYVRRATDQRRLELLPDGRIGAGAAAAERRWRLEQIGGTSELSIEGDFGVLCRLRLERDGVWRGRWLQFEQMPIELIPLGRE